MGHVDGEPLGAQPALERARQPALVFDHKNPHRSLASLLAADWLVPQAWRGEPESHLRNTPELSASPQADPGKLGGGHMFHRQTQVSVKQGQ
jgi:hypothetical protein